MLAMGDLYYYGARGLPRDQEQVSLLDDFHRKCCFQCTDRHYNITLKQLMPGTLMECVEQQICI